jgi:hypothetical protein
VLGLTINCCVIAFFLFLILPYNVYNLSELAFWCDPTTTDAHIAAYDAGELVSAAAAGMACCCP